MSDYAYPQRRKTKGDKKAKARYMRYKRGGTFRSTKIIEGEKKRND